MCTAGIATPDPSPHLTLRSRAGMPPTSSEYRPGYLGTTSPSLGAGASAFAGRQPQPSPPLGFAQLGSSLTGLPSPTVHLGAGALRGGGGGVAVGRARTYSSASSGSYSWSPALGQHASGLANSYGSSVSDQQQVAAAAAAACSDIYDYHHQGQAAGSSFTNMYGTNASHSHGSSSSPTSTGSPTAHDQDFALSKSFADLALDASEPRRAKGGFMQHHLDQVRAHETGGADDESSIAPPEHVVSGVLTLVEQE
ncbi:hypothetical protein BCR44DRAFT_1059066 [Catenaria anguillulae PL171]|uniref:Uncharacterized protein n=1 Tax=Catenaria anguillulae PL171 TaxID=765915 RepID=A0A1Y2HQ81_9FUNG|nr:hypothetical protein BCR44DRAFT_1059066 [Catenaria anguillulae PL171]